MPHYFFDVHDGVEIIDEAGQHLPDIAAAKREAMQIAANFVSRARLLDDNGGALVVSVRDGPDSVLATVRLGIVVDA